MDSARGQLLIAGPALVDPNFWRTVVLIVEHSEEGAFGLVLNRPSETLVGEAAPEIEELVDPDEPLYIGGPVQPSGVVVLGQFEDASDGVLLAFADVGVLGAGLVTRRARRGAARRQARSSATRAGAPASSRRSSSEATGSSTRRNWRTPSPSEPRELWSSVLTRKGGSYALVARMPADPSLN